MSAVARPGTCAIFSIAEAGSEPFLIAIKGSFHSNILCHLQQVAVTQSANSMISISDTLRSRKTEVVGARGQILTMDPPNNLKISLTRNSRNAKTVGHFWPTRAGQSRWNVLQSCHIKRVETC